MSPVGEAMDMIDIENLRVRRDGVDILKNLTLRVGAGEVHAIMGPNGAGKTTLFHVLAGSPFYEVVLGSILFRGKDLLSMTVEERAHHGLFLSFQSPVEIEGLSTMTLLKEMTEANRLARNLPKMNAAEFLRHVRSLSAPLNIKDDMLRRPFNFGFSGGERKRMEILQMLLLEPKLILLDEIDSGLDVDALRCLVDYLKKATTADTSLLVITHYEHLFKQLSFDQVHVLIDGRCAQSGDMSLARFVNEKGYSDLGALDF